MKTERMRCFLDVRSAPDCRAKRLGRSFAACVVAALLCLPVLADVEPFRVGFSRHLFTDVKDADARASIKAWAKTVARERDINMNPTAQLYDRTEQMVTAMSQGSVDAMSMTLNEYVDLSKKVKTSHWFVTQTAGSLFEEYILLVRAEGEIANLQDLEGHAIVFHESARTNLAMDWLDHMVISHGHNELAEGFFDQIQRVNKVSAAVLPVFFGSAEAAVVADSNFKMMCELNPQLRRQLKVIAKSPPLVPAIMCFRENFESPEKERVMTALRELHMTPAGEQVLTIFQSQALVPVDEGPLLETAAFVREAARLRLDARKNAAKGSSNP